MKTILSIALIVSGLFILAGCPVSSTYPLGKKGDVKLDTRLIGTFSNTVGDVEADKIIVTKGSEANTYNVHVEEKGSSFMADGEDFVGWLTKMDDQTFFVLQQLIDGEAEETYYVYHIEFNKSGFTSSDISLKVNGVDAITSIEAYREEVKASMGMEGFLASQIEWKKD
ncbi:MAG: hypothetical protein A3D31_05790 [Candidatus Fluviicola riflensis]|nr:MAG: hypothetical protein CHH17_09225 [Candidatus Fluviicola riflensis]OGS79481.1 MAG: hypothetical protein A3D31_05790 [Candidatus Fluviicola riflensis]OGS86912.1 MAG: hypothetical protein A2724_05250 [Fluviicola sp. RIFCSPHIGHO2_01_FULL_43_53]OGS89703.1 MAG: hypothetical protein A3E30_01995 [Fluviicola sp. RIFCSPHIGHO2_12_FULL_43_24]